MLLESIATVKHTKTKLTNMAKVEMPLEELRELEKKAENALALVEVKNQEIKEVQLKLREVEANKMIVKKTIYPKVQSVPKSKITFDVAKNLAHRIGMKLSQFCAIKVMETHLRDRLHSFNSDYDALRVDHEIANPVERIIASAMINCEFSNYSEAYHGPQEEEKVEYINFEDVQRELREKAEEGVAKELGELRNKVQTLNVSHNKEEARLKTNYEERLRNAEVALERTVKGKDEAYIKLQREYDALKEDKDMRTTEQKLLDEIQKLKEELAKEAEKPWWKKLFG